MTEGYTLELVQESWPQIDKKIRNGVRKAGRFLKVRVGSLEELRRLHWNPVYLPRRLRACERVYVATLDEVPVSAIMVEVRGNTLIYRMAGNDPEHRDLQGNSLLLWHLSRAQMSDVEVLKLLLTKHSGDGGINLTTQNLVSREGPVVGVAGWQIKTL